MERSELAVEPGFDGQVALSRGPHSLGNGRGRRRGYGLQRHCMHHGQLRAQLLQQGDVVPAYGLGVGTALQRFGDEIAKGKVDPGRRRGPRSLVRSG